MMSMTDTNSQKETVLVTGGSGFIGIYCILQLLQEGYKVRTTVRQEKRKEDIFAMLKTAGIDPANKISFVLADLTKDDGWSEAVKNCTYVLHIASPFPMMQPKNENDLIVPARDGTLRVLKAARDAGVKRVVITSSFAAIGYGHKNGDKPFNEDNWSDVNGKISPYAKSKTIAERAAWDFIAKEGRSLELAVVNPVGVMGPLLGPDYSTSIELLKQLMNGIVPRAPKIYFNFVDVRDVADLHIRAMKDPKAKGERFLATVGDSLSILDVSKILQKHFNGQVKRLPSKEMPNFMVKLVAQFRTPLKELVPNLGVVRRASDEKAKNVLNWNPRSNEESIIATAESLLQLKIVTN